MGEHETYSINGWGWGGADSAVYAENLEEDKAGGGWDQIPLKRVV